MQAEESVTVKKAMAYRWLIWIVLLVAFVIVHFHRLSLGVVREELTRDFGMTAMFFANLGAVYFYVYMVMQIPTGILVDSLGVRKTVTGGTIISGLGSIIFGLAPNLQWLFIGRLLVGLGVSATFIAILKIQSQWFLESEFGTLSGITSFVGLLGGVLAQSPLAFLVAVMTWRFTFTAIGVFSFFLAVVCYLIVRNTPVDMGLPPVLEPEKAKETQKEKDELGPFKGLLGVLKNWGTWVAFGLFACFYGPFIALTSLWGTSYMVEVYGLSKISAANYMATVVLSLAVGAIVIGKLSDFLKRRKLPMFIFGFVNVLCWVVILFWQGGKPPLEIMLPLLSLLGFSTAVFILSWACSKEINPVEISGIATSVVNTGGFLGGAILPALMGLVITRYGDILPAVELYRKAFMFCLLSAILGLVFILFIKETNCRQIG